MPKVTIFSGDVHKFMNISGATGSSFPADFQSMHKHEMPAAIQFCALESRI